MKPYYQSVMAADTRKEFVCAACGYRYRIVKGAWSSSRSSPIYRCPVCAETREVCHTCFTDLTAPLPREVIE